MSKIVAGRRGYSFCGDSETNERDEHIAKNSTNCSKGAGSNGLS